MKIIFYIGSFGGSAYYRFIKPAYLLKKLGYSIYIKTEMELPDMDSDVIFIQRTCNEAIYKNCLYLKNKGCKIIYDIDDDLFNLDKENPGYKYFSDKTIRNNYCEFLKMADAVTVSTKPLKELYAEYNDNIFVIPNLIDFTDYDKWFLEKEDDGITIIGWAGSPTHQADIAVIEDKLIELMNKYPDIRLKLVGWDFTQKPKWDSLRGRIEHAYQPPHKFGAEMKEFDIAIAPLADTIFNESKSNLKYLEYSAMGIPTVASNIYPYSSTISINNGLLADNAIEFYSKLEFLINNKLYAEHIGLNAYKFVRNNFNLKNNITYYENLINQFQNSKIYNIGAN